MSSQPGRSNRGKRGGKTKATRTSEPGPGPGLTLKERLKPASKSVGNSPASSPLLSRKVLTRTSIESSSPLKSLDDTSLIDLTGISEIDLLTQPDVDLQTGIIDEVPECPCALPLSKNSVFIKCTGCSQDWHCSCVNLAGITAAAVKKLASWKCPRCYSSPFSRETNKSNQIAFEEFKQVSAEFSEHSERITVLEKGLTDIKGMLEKLPSSLNKQCNDEFSLHYTDITEELKSVRQNIEHIGSLGLVIEESNKKTEESISELQNMVQQTIASPPDLRPQSEPDFSSLETKITSINDQLSVLNQHVRQASSRSEFVRPDPDVDDLIPMTPNTSSPHLTSEDPGASEGINSVTASAPCEPFVSYKDSAINEDMKDRLLEFVQGPDAAFKNVGNNRDVIYLGEFGYWYTGAYHPAAETPEVIQDLLQVVRPCLSEEKAWINSCLITRYKSNSDHIPLHRDDELYIDPESEIISVSVGADRSLKFVDNAESREEILNVSDCSAYVMSRYSQDFWRHGIDAVAATPESGDPVQTEPILNTEDQVRYSFTFRHIAPFFRNSTVVIGDSNTQNFEFGYQRGKFGRWMPGKRVKAAKVEHIPQPSEIGPFRNVVIHTGINNLTDKASPHKVINTLKKKCESIRSTYPNGKLHISLLLPTKSPYLNSKVNELNSLILDFAYGKKNIFIIDNNNLSNERGCMPPDMGRFVRGIPKSSDIVHLGRRGISKFCANIKESIVHIKSASSRATNSQSTQRFSGGSGDYRAAAQRGLNASHRLT